MSKVILINKVGENLEDVRFPFYDGSNEQMSGFELHLETGELTTFSATSAHGVPADVWYNRAIRFEVADATTRENIILMAEDKKEYFQHILNADGDEQNDLISEWERYSYGFTSEENIIDVKEQMQYEQLPETEEDLDELVSRMIEYDGDFGLYSVEPDETWLENEILDYMYVYQYLADVNIGKFIAQKIVERGINSGDQRTDGELFKLAQ